MTLEVMNLYDLPARAVDQFDIVFFHGLRYQLPDPVTGLRVAADHCRELMFVSTATASGLPDGLLQVERESQTMLLSGTHGLNWRPSGPAVVEEILKWAGFTETQLLWWEKETSPGWGRLELLAKK